MNVDGQRSENVFIFPKRDQLLPLGKQVSPKDKGLWSFTRERNFPQRTEWYLIMIHGHIEGIIYTSIGTGVSLEMLLFPDVFSN